MKNYRQKNFSGSIFLRFMKVHTFKNLFLVLHRKMQKIVKVTSYLKRHVGQNQSAHQVFHRFVIQ